MSEVEFLREQGLELLLRLGTAIFCGGLIGFERNSHGSPAGVKTFVLVCVGAAAYMLTGHLLLRDQKPPGDPTRVAAQIVSGIGFLGAGAILRGDAGVTGLTTAATIWLTGAIGILIGCGMEITALLLTILSVVSMRLLFRFEVKLGIKPQFIRDSQHSRR